MDFPTVGRECSVVAIEVLDSIYSAPAHITTTLQVVAVCVHLQQKLTILDLYITWEEDFILPDLQELLWQLQQPRL